MPSNATISVNIGLNASKPMHKVEKQYDEQQVSNIREIEKVVVAGTKFINEARTHTSSRVGKQLQSSDHKTVNMLRQNGFLVQRFEAQERQRRMAAKESGNTAASKKGAGTTKSQFEKSPVHSLMQSKRKDVAPRASPNLLGRRSKEREIQEVAIVGPSQSQHAKQASRNMKQ